MPTSESKDHPTPNGGVRSTIYYLDDKGKPVEKEQATRAEVIEYDALGNVVGRTYAIFRGSDNT